MHCLQRTANFLILASSLLLSTALCHASVPAAEQNAKKIRTVVAKSAIKNQFAGNPGIKSNAVLVVDEADSTVLFAKKADVPAPIASITKLMTALVVLEAGQALDELIEITKDDRALERGTHSRLALGTSLTRGELLHLALMSSENRAAHALGRTFPGGIDAVVREMNDKAKALGMQRTYFADTTGLSSKNVASPADLTKLVITASNHPVIREYSTDKKLAVRVGPAEVEFRNTNHLVLNPDWDISVQKTGFTNAAGQCLVMKAMIENRSVVIVLLNSIGKYTRVADARRIRRWVEGGFGKPVQTASVKADAGTS